MAGYLEAYGAGVDRRLKIYRWAALAAVAVLIVAVILYFQFRDYPEQKKIQGFLNSLQSQDYKAAYSYWGCSESHPCRQYSFEKFLEDWGPKSPHANARQAKLATKKSCTNGVIQFIEFPGQDDVQLWVERKDKVIGFAPWPVCNPRMQAP